MRLKAIGNILSLETGESMNTGTSNWHRAIFTFDQAWEGMSRVVVWRTVYGKWILPLKSDVCLVPEEALAHPVDLLVAVYGVVGKVVLTTNYVSLGRVEPGADDPEVGSDET